MASGQNPKEPQRKNLVGSMEGHSHASRRHNIQRSEADPEQFAPPCRRLEGKVNAVEAAR
ncbi:hypothetical protein HPP92_023245 [Vanilla planifolia]|uniref:Uncharacterized protein n=1 Tax=Vanilla planifolia TaxID=51239 RepID=A0A835UFV9_VANPL|nr:hypothetical protein HPP92_023245 [Vanilla planifolia]